jgi:hypothetical protein
VIPVRSFACIRPPVSNPLGDATLLTPPSAIKALPTEAAPSIRNRAPLGVQIGRGADQRAREYRLHEPTSFVRVGRERIALLFNPPARLRFELGLRKLHVQARGPHED